MSAIIQKILEDMENLPPEMQEETLDFVRFLKAKLVKIETVTPQAELNGVKVATIMAELASRGTAFQTIKDPIAWQRELRQDRPLPGRE